jgi:hydrogenase small subunit
MKLSRRDFLSISSKLSALLCVGNGAVSQIAHSLEELSQGNPAVLWLQGQSCSGCSVSLLNSDAPGPAELLTQYIRLLFHSTLSTATGEVGIDIIHKTIETGGYILATEGSVPAGMPSACKIGEETYPDLLTKAASRAKAILAIGTCAAFGGIPAADNNLTGAKSVPSFLKQKGISKPIIAIPGCPSHPDWVVGSIVHVINYGIPELDQFHRPKLFFDRLVHDQCPRFADYERERFAATFSEDGCLFKLGCLGPNTHADCTTRQWNSGTNTCINAGAPCIGCASTQFVSNASFPLYTKTQTKMS